MASLIYRFIVSPIAFLVLLPFLKALKLGPEKLQKTIALRLDQSWKTKKLRSPIWFHCASGEFEYAKPIIRALKQFKPELEILLTYYSPSIEKQVKNFEDIDLALPLPRDLFTEMKSFILTQNPKCLLIARTDAWPELVYQARANGLPSLLFSATLSSASGRTKGFSRLLYKDVFSQLSDIYCVTDDDQREFSQLGTKTQISVTGDTRFDQVLHRVENPRDVKKNLFSQLPNKVFLTGSSWKEDEQFLIDTMNLCQSEIHWVIAPHEPSEDHLDHLEVELARLGFKSDRYTDIDSWDGSTVLIIDCVGILADLYAYADFALVGGSFKRSVHSVMEPLACGNITFVGPFHENNREALEFKHLPVGNSQDLMMVNPVLSPSLMAQIIDLWSAQDTKTIKSLIQQEVVNRSGASQAVLNWIAEKI